MFIHYKHLLYFNYMFRRYVHHYQGERLCLLLKTPYSYVAINNGFYIVDTSHIIQGTTLHILELQHIYIYIYIYTYKHIYNS